MLNAFRHQRSKHLISRMWGRFVTRAQRLSASKIETLGLAQFFGRGGLCSTPFGIRGRITRPAYQTIRVASFVLCSTPFGIRGRITPRMTARRSRHDPKCSTPFGIRGRITSQPTRAGVQGACLYVLNAFRHQRKDHSKHMARLTASFSPGRVLNAFRHQRKDHP